MVSLLPSCPFLPAPRLELDWRALHRFRDNERKEQFYLTCLEYSQTLWTKGLAARSILCLDRAFGADLDGSERAVKAWPLPYGAIAWLIVHTPPGLFVGNPRIHFQHYAGRMNFPRREQRRWRAWACWALTRAVRPDLPGDPCHAVVEPTISQISEHLRFYGLAGEVDLWCGELKKNQKQITHHA